MSSIEDYNVSWNTLSDPELLEKFEGERVRVVNDWQLAEHIGDTKRGPFLDYGCGAGLFAGMLQLDGADVQVYDAAPTMRKRAVHWVGRENVFERVDDIPNNHYRKIVCTLVVCIVEAPVVAEILMNIRRKMSDDGTLYLTICNPHIFNVPETALDLRFPGTHAYEDEFDLPKIKKEGRYGVKEKHRPAERYWQWIQEARLELKRHILSPEYTLVNGERRWRWTADNPSGEVDGTVISDYLTFVCEKA